METKTPAKEKIVLKPITRQFIRSLRGKYKNSGLMDELMAEKRRERNL
jgi:hypothetical protein